MQQTVRLDIALTLGQISESIEVVAAAAQLQSENSTVGTVIENARIVELPLNGRNYLQLVALSPNVTTISPSAGQAGSRQGGDRAGQSIAVAGQRIMFDHFTLDGVENTDPNFNTYVILPSVDALQEFKVQTGVYPAEFGRNATQINVLTKSGGNDYHGTLFEFLRNDKLDAKNYAFTAARPPRTPSSGTSTASPWADRFAFRSCSTAKTVCSSWPTTRRSGSAVRCKLPTQCPPPTCRAATSAASPT